MYERAIIFIDQNELESASKELDAAITVDGTYFKAYLQQAVIAEKKGDYTLAKELAGKSRELAVK